MAYAHTLSNHPPNDMFYMRIELKRAMRGMHLLVEDQPRNFLKRELNILEANVTTKLTSLPWGMR
jgi:hypothetical protein